MGMVGLTSPRTWVVLAVATVALMSADRPAYADDAGCLVVAAWGEARGEPLPVIEAVVSTIVNRARSRGLSVCDAVMDPAAFTGVTPAMHELFVEAAKPKGPQPITEQPHTGHDRAQLAAVEAAASAALAGQLPDRTNGATHFYSPAGMRELGMKSAPAWASSMVRTASLGPFIFLREKKIAEPVEASILPPAPAIVTWADPTAEVVPPVAKAHIAVATPSGAAINAEPIDFGTIDIVAAAKPVVPGLSELDPLGLAAWDILLSDILVGGGGGLSSTNAGPVDLTNLDIATADAEDAAVANASVPIPPVPNAAGADPVVGEKEGPILEVWRSTPPMRWVKTRLPDLGTMVDIQPLATIAEEREVEVAAADTQADTNAARDETDAEEPDRDDTAAAAPPQDIRPGALPWPRVPSSAEQLPPAPIPPRGRLSAVSAWVPPGEVVQSRSNDAASEWDVPLLPPRGRARNLRLWSPEPGTVLACRGPDRGAVLLALHGARVQRQVVDGIRCGD